MIYFIVDSTFNLSAEYIKAHSIRVVSLKIVLGGKTYCEADQSVWADFYKRLEKTKEKPQTSCPSPEDFKQTIEEIYSHNEAQEHIQIFILTFSKAVSGTYNSARLAASEYNENEVLAIDLQTYTTTSKLILEEAVSAVENHQSYREVKNNIEKNIKNATVRFIPANMKSLQQGGRVSLLTAVIVDTLYIKPVLEFKSGIFRCFKKALGAGKAMMVMLSSVPKNYKKLNLMYIQDNTLAEKLKKAAIKIFGREDFEIIPLGPIAGTHIGVGSIGAAYLEN